MEFSLLLNAHFPVAAQLLKAMPGAFPAPIGLMPPERMERAKEMVESNLLHGSGLQLLPWVKRTIVSRQHAGSKLVSAAWIAPDIATMRQFEAYRCRLESAIEESIPLFFVLSSEALRGSSYTTKNCLLASVNLGLDVIVLSTRLHPKRDFCSPQEI